MSPRGEVSSGADTLVAGAGSSTGAVAPRRENVCAVVVSFHPGSGFLDRIAKISREVAEVVVVDNTPGDGVTEHLRSPAAHIPVHVISNQDNLGIATALNQGIEWACRRGYAWALLFDQDSIPAKNFVERLGRVYECYGEQDRIAVIGANFREVALGRTPVVLPGGSSEPWAEMHTVITSGSLLSLRAASRIGPLRDEFFIDHVDNEYCLRARARGYKVLITREVLVNHELGAPTLHRVFGRLWQTSNHSPLRHYYMVRNHVTLLREYWMREPAWAKQSIHTEIKSLILLLLLERGRPAKLRYMLRGLRDATFGKLGRYE